MKKKIAIILAAMMLFTAGCGNSGATRSAEAGAYKSAAAPAAAATNGIYTESYGDHAMGAEEYEEYDVMEMADEASGSTGSSSPDTPATQATNRKLIRNISMQVETREFDELVAKVDQRTAFYGGYTEYSSTYNGSNYSGRRTRTSTMTLRIPANKMDEFLSEVAEASNVVQRDENVSDVTLNYVDMESHKNALKAQEKRLIEMMDKAETIEDLITLESRLGDIRYQIESMESQLRTYDNQVDYATLHLSITEVEELTPVEEQSDLEYMQEGFFRSLRNIGDNIKNFFMNLVIDLPYLLLSLLKLVIVLLIVRFIAHKIFGKKITKRVIASIRNKFAKKIPEEKAADTEVKADNEKKDSKGKDNKDKAEETKEEKAEK